MEEWEIYLLPGLGTLNTTYFGNNEEEGYFKICEGRDQGAFVWLNGNVRQMGALQWAFMKEKVCHNTANGRRDVLHSLHNPSSKLQFWNSNIVGPTFVEIIPTGILKTCNSSSFVYMQKNKDVHWLEHFLLSLATYEGMYFSVNKQ